MARVTVEDCLDKVENRFELVLVAAKRAHQLNSGGYRTTLDVGKDKATVLALREIEAGLIDASILTDEYAIEEELNAQDKFSEEVKMSERGRQRGSFYKNLLKLQETFNCIDEARIPIIMAIQGACVGGAVDFASACDFRYCTEDAFFCIQEINIGMTADVGTFPRLQYQMPLGLVKELAFTGRRLYAEEAHSTGLVNKVFEDKEKMIEHAMEIAQEISRKTPLAVWGSKDMINYTRGRTIREGLDRISLWQSGMFNPEADMREAMSSNLEERDAEFEDLYPLKKDLGL